MTFPFRRFRLSPPRPPAGGPTEPSGRSWWDVLRTPLHPRQLVGHNPGLKVIAFLLAVFVWFTINASERDAERRLEIPVVLRKVERGLVVTNPPAKLVSVRVRGPRTLVDGIDERGTRLSIDLTGLTQGEHRIDLNGQTMLRPELVGRVKALGVDPPRVKLQIERLARRTLPVRPDLAGLPAFGFTVAESRVDPLEVEVTGPASRLDDLKEVSTEPIDLRGETALTSERVVGLATVADFVNFAPDEVTVTVRLEDVPMSRDFRRVPVKVLNADGAEIQPGWVDLTVKGPQRILHNLALADGAVYVDASTLPPGSHQVDVRVDLPAGLEIVRTAPDKQVVRMGGGGN
jgi:YbbR domain-containing protein